MQTLRLKILHMVKQLRGCTTLQLIQQELFRSNDHTEVRVVLRQLCIERQLIQIPFIIGDCLGGTANSLWLPADSIVGEPE